jgi:hypothetical protein
MGMDGDGVDSNRKGDGSTYTPMMDCFFGASLLMMASGDQAIKGLRGDGRMDEMKKSRCKMKMKMEDEVEDGTSKLDEKNFLGPERTDGFRPKTV